MQDISSDCDTSSTSLGQRRGISDLARFALDLTWATPPRAESETPARPRAYPSPPMSGSPPPHPPKANPEAGDRGQLHGSYPSTNPQDAYRGGLPPPPPTATTIHQSELRGPPLHQSLPPPQPRSYHAEQQDRMSYAYPRPDDHLRNTPSGYAHLANQALQQRPQPYMHMSGPPPSQPAGPHQHGYATTMSQTSQDSAPYTSPKTQRKTKGHVASACVPCKRAHLRCDAQRPCSRCTSNGKEDACVDVQHKKRGRPRLRDDREARYGPSTYQHPQDAAAAASRRPPLSHYSAAGPPISGYDDPIRGSHSYRVLKSQPSEPNAPPRYLDRASMADANIYGQPPPPLATGAPEPVVFLTMELEIARASQAFADAVGIPSVRGRSLLDIVLASERDKIQNHQRSMQDERSRKDPVYLPPIFGRQEQERVFDSLRFEADEISRFQLDRQDFFVFAAADGQPRSYSVRLGLAKRESIYFIVLLVNAAPRFPYPSPSPHAREVPYLYQQPQQQQQQQQAYAQHTPVSATFDHTRSRYGEGALAPRPSPGQPPHMTSGLSPGMPSYSASPSRPDYAAGPSSYQIPRSELPPTTRPPQPSFQLPPIRAGPHHQPTHSEPSWQRDDRSGRVDIGGLLEKPDPQQRRQQ
ncbi:uncharacterized protein LY79DRAFT_513830 [Colletotrichum navitas]|uniref:Zn(2)-C6 fungal-type domain-containing protein n=1 Tax=Colletotrichum navitas TaxID=681940 RepID=A0AAD8V6Z3_9PEZI|nr:uncharacterized protein LY79DRAFT_513830 [Colletotrichum navitas]KAK1593870.1 hypothetical protein LY79DRAFT_513830 [Colletotrichum navitas]